MVGLNKAIIFGLSPIFQIQNNLSIKPDSRLLLTSCYLLAFFFKPASVGGLSSFIFYALAFFSVGEK
jgi:hypothetical protein